MKKKQECIPVGCIPPALYYMGALLDRDPPGQIPALKRDPLDRDPPQQKHPGQRPPCEQNHRQV